MTQQQTGEEKRISQNPVVRDSLRTLSGVKNTARTLPFDSYLISTALSPGGAPVHFEEIRLQIVSIIIVEILLTKNSGREGMLFALLFFCVFIQVPVSVTCIQIKL